MQPIDMIMIYYWGKYNGGHLELETSNEYFLIVIISPSRTCNLFLITCYSNKSLL